MHRSGLYLEHLQPTEETTRLPVRNALLSVWVEVDPQGAAPAGVYPVRCAFSNEDGKLATEMSIDIEIIDAELPP